MRNVIKETISRPSMTSFGEELTASRTTMNQQLSNRSDSSEIPLYLLQEAWRKSKDNLSEIYSASVKEFPSEIYSASVKEFHNHDRMGMSSQPPYSTVLSQQVTESLSSMYYVMNYLQNHFDTILLSCGCFDQDKVL